MVDYKSKQTTAQRMIKSYGRRVTLEGSITGGDFRSTDTTSAKKKKLTALFLEYEAVTADIQIGDKKCLVDQKSIGTGNIKDFDYLVEKDGTRWKIHDVSTIQPGDLPIYHELQVRQ